MARQGMIFGFAGFFAGVALRSFFTWGYDVGILFFALGIIFLAIFYLKSERKTFICFLSVFLIASGIGILRYNFEDSRINLSSFYEASGMRVRVSGVITETPKIQEKFTRAVLTADSISGQKASAKILLTLPHYPEVNYGDSLSLEGKLTEPKKFSDDFDWPAYLAKDNVYFEMFFPRVTYREPGGGIWIKRYLFKIRDGFLANLSRVLPEPKSSYLAGLTIGDRAEISQELKEEFRKVGVIHLVVLSGYNISVIAENSMKFLGWLSFSVGLKTAIASIFIILFSVMVGGSATIVRAAIMGLLLLFANYTGRVYQALSALFAAAFLMIFMSPKILRFDISFQLSFLATLSLIIFLPRIEKYFLWIPEKYKFRETILSTISTQIFVLPLLILSSGYISIVSLPANVLILGLVPITMFLGFLTGLTGFASNFLSQIFAWPTFWLLSWQLSVINFFSKFSSVIFEISGVSFWIVSLLYGIIAFFLARLIYKETYEKKI